MQTSSRRAPHRVLTALSLAAAGCCILSAHAAAPAYNPIHPSMGDTTVTLTGHDLTIEQVIQVARYGAKVALSADAKQREADNLDLLLEAQREGVQVYLLNRGGGTGRENTILAGDPDSPDTRTKLQTRELAAFQRGPTQGDGPEIADEEAVRALMVIRANIMTHETPSPQLAQMLLDLLNKRVTPVVQSRGTVGEADIATLANVGGTMVGKGEAYYRGVRMPAAQALRQAGLGPLKPFGVDSSTLDNSNAYTISQAALLVAEARQALDWTDLTYAMDLSGMNSSIAPLSKPTQLKRPSKWLNWDAQRVLDMLRGSYLFDGDTKRTIADPDSLRASSIRQGSAWQSWAALRDSVLFQMNSSDHNPTVDVGLSPSDSWELSTPQMMQYYVKGSAKNGYKHGYIVANANWDPYPMTNEIEAFDIALANMTVVVTHRIYRFNNPFFTVLKTTDIPEAQRGTAPRGGGALTTELSQEIQVLANPVPAEGISTDDEANGDLESEAGVKVMRARQMVDITMHLLGQDLLTGAYWMNLRKVQNSARRFGAAPEAALAALRQVIPWQDTTQTRPVRPNATMAYEFIKATPVTTFFPAATSEPGGELQIPGANATFTDK